ncbi:hypothetical protein C5B90_16005 [Haloferax sp. Atlit-12N]|uniref:hypothetical protein n=1 Tax=Haloferax sp. Atlit-12N TaxID=2077203 RepID=UPI000E21D91D|nr:hypothetical protein [Haloferax sp. Atlit-12N]RDZ62666.1 hypothetical protein C5B90_16005 [Haloferax sp. Atlit-12N]
MSERTLRHASSPRDDTRTESPRADRPAFESSDDAAAHGGPDAQAQPTLANRWRPTVRQGIALWALITVGWAVVPADHPLQIAVAVSGVYASLLLPTALYFDFRERRSESNAAVLRETASELADRVRGALPGRGGATRSSCSCNR